jgi:excinuclease ABC subunit A
VLNRLADMGNTVLVIEHNLDVIKCADWLIDMGPEGGDGGGRVVATGTPEQVADAADSHTAEYLKPKLRPAPKSPTGPGKKPGRRAVPVEPVSA